MADKIKKAKQKKSKIRKKSETVTVKERKLIKARIEGKTVTEAAKKAGLGRTYASQALNKPHVKELFTDLMDKAGLTDNALANKINQLSNAKETKFFAFQGEIGDQVEVEAIETQRKMTEFACKLKGHLVEKVEGSLSEDTLSRIIMLPIKTPLDTWKPPDDK